MAKCSREHSATTLKLIVEFVARDLHPLSTVEGIGFRCLVKYFDPSYQVPLHTHITTVMKQLHSTIKEDLLQDLDSAQYVALSIDIWTSQATEAYLTITALFVLCKWKIIAKVLQTHEMPEHHTSVNIAERLWLAAEEWKTIDRDFRLVHSNASNFTLAASNMEGWGHIGCFAHTFQLCVHYGLSDSAISRLTAQCQNL